MNTAARWFYYAYDIGMRAPRQRELREYSLRCFRLRFRDRVRYLRGRRLRAFQSAVLCPDVLHASSYADKCRTH